MEGSGILIGNLELRPIVLTFMVYQSFDVMIMLEEHM